MKFSSILRNGILVLSLVAGNAALAQSWQVGALRISDAWARPTVAQQAHGVAYLSIENTGKQGDKLLRASSPISQAVELHTMTMDKDIVRMRQLDDISVPAASKLALKPGNGPHLMLIELKEPLQAGKSINLVLEFEKAGKITVNAKIKAQP